MKSISVIVPTALLACAGGLLVTAPAAEAAGGAAPACVKRKVGTTDSTPSSAQVKLTNTCASSKRVKVVFTHAHDSACLTLKPKGTATVHSNIARPFSSFDKTVSC